MAAPHLLRVALEEYAVQHPAEAVDIEVFQGGLGALVDTGEQIAEPCFERGEEAHVADGGPLQGDGIVEEMALEIDAADPIADQHDPIRCLRVWAVWSELLLRVQALVVPGGCPLQGHELSPPPVHPLVLAEEPVTADVHAVAMVADGLGDAADAVRGLQDGDSMPFFQQLYGGGEARGACPDDHDMLCFHSCIIPTKKRGVKRRSVSLPFVCFLAELYRISPCPELQAAPAAWPPARRGSWR